MSTAYALEATATATATATAAPVIVTEAAAASIKKVIKKKKAPKPEMAAAAAEEGSSAVAECTVCCEPYNKSSHLPVTCEFADCLYKACKECVRAYLLSSTNEPHCMNCNKGWSEKSLLILNRSWLTDLYRDHRQKLLVDVELSRIPETMQLAENYKSVKREEEEISALRVQIALLKKKEHELNHLISKRHEKIRVLKGGSKSTEEKKVFFMPCPATECNGMLSTQYKCGICELFTCPDCHEIIGAHKTDAHTCNADNVASAEAIKKETRQCPGCHNRIYRVEGCSQMWCTGCHTAFDWNTGKKVVSERLHNPHWLEYQRKMNGGAAPRAPGDVPCGGLITYTEARTIVSKMPTEGSNNKYTRAAVESIFALVQNYTTNIVRTTREGLQRAQNYEEQRIKYIVGEMTKKEFEAMIFRNDRSRRKNIEVLHIYELISAVGVDTFNRLLAMSQVRRPATEFYAELAAELDQYEALILHSNDLIEEICNTYNLSLLYVDLFNAKAKVINIMNVQWNNVLSKVNPNHLYHRIMNGVPPA
jgi:hypothetical protein